MQPPIDTRPNFTQAPAPAEAAATLRVLHVEDDESDHALVLAHLRRGGLRVQATRVQTADELHQALQAPWDLIVSDYHLPGFSGLQALDIVRARGLDLPFILVSGQIGEDTAVEAMHRGASDYLLKDHLARLAPAVDKALDAHRMRQARLAADRALQASQAQLSALAQHLQGSIEAERAAIAREIHDDVGGSLTALRFDLAWIERHAASEPVAQRARQALDVLTHAYEASQRLMRNLRPAILDQGLVAALQWLVEGWQRRTGIEVALVAEGPPAELPVGVPLVAYRTAQEALTNIGKHAQASAVRIELAFTGQALSLEVQDNGRGWSPADLAKAGSFGLRGLQERAKLVGGWIDLLSGSDGSTVILSVPLATAGTGSDAEWLGGPTIAGPVSGAPSVRPGAHPTGAPS